METTSGPLVRNRIGTAGKCCRIWTQECEIDSCDCEIGFRSQCLPEYPGFQAAWDRLDRRPLLDQALCVRHGDLEERESAALLDRGITVTDMSVSAISWYTP